MEKIFNSDMFMLCLCIAVGVFALISIVSLVLLIVTMVKLKKMRQNYRLFMNGKTAENLEDAMLDNSNNGYVINSMHNREGCYTYVKEIIKGESFIPLGDEESKALSQAMGTDIPV